MNIGYCTNVHSGTTLDEVLKNIELYSAPVKSAVSPNQPMGIGLWLAADTVRETLADGNWQKLRDALDKHQLFAHSFNAFPFSNFHQEVVKQHVYLPDWTSEERLNYTNDVATLMSRLLPEGSQGTISTLPIGWSGKQGPTPAYFSAAQSNLLESVSHLREIRDDKHIHLKLCIEPEPGCLLQTSAQLVDFMNWYLFHEKNDGEQNRPFLGVCHDLCHASVMFESAQGVLQRYQQYQIPIAKVQISSCIQADFGMPNENFTEIIDALRQFEEPRYMHQTTIRCPQPPMHYFDDLFLALRVQQTDRHSGLLRTHFHVPIDLADLAPLTTTQQDVRMALNWFIENNYSSQFEVETYAWDVSPNAIQTGSLVDSICSELNWLNQNYPGLADLNNVSQVQNPAD